MGVGTAFIKNHPDLVQFFENVQLTGDQTNAVILRMNEKKLSGQVVAREFLQANPQLWEKWVPAAVASKVKASLK